MKDYWNQGQMKAWLWLDGFSQVTKMILKVRNKLGKNTCSGKLKYSICTLIPNSPFSQMGDENLKSCPEIKEICGHENVVALLLLNTQYYKVRIKGKVKQSREWSRALPYILF